MRLDLCHPIIGGNKWMKLKGFAETAIADGKAGILTKGGPWSNHLHACAWLCKEPGLACHAWIKGHSRLMNAMLMDMAGWNATITYVNRTRFYEEKEAIEFAAGNNLLYVPMGGAEETGVRQVLRFFQQLCLSHYDYAVCAVGTATTFGGIAGTENNFTNIIGIDAGTGDDAVKEKIKAWQNVLPYKKLSFLTGYHFGGFARYTPELACFMNELFTGYGIPTDVVYTGKLFYAVHHLAIQHYFPPGARLLIVHSGGLQGNRSLPHQTLEF